ncbi:ABC transporter substrate-binding protein [Streptomyces longispororuber]|uniref:ABC transporter substrate-binding protein n=1 Tax=Streptomyces longispororuber TaxID=68230 RepID=UPI00210AAB80|nr:ABC transporter substrate-binding protein [Streptomyces longispororuber]MCQ4213220.1 ABC transporter substrate-binding protein [Streptomyces longispororuber]
MVVDPDGGLRFQPRRPRRLKWPWQVAGILAIAALAWAVIGPLTPADDGKGAECAPGIHQTGPRKECIGVSDGSFVFEDSLKDVMSKIATENGRVEKSGKKYVSVVYAEPLTTVPGEEEAKYGLRGELMGAYLAQRELNDPELGAGRGDLPQIRLLVGNLGLRSEQWKELTDDLIDRSAGKDQVVAVAGFGQSRGGTRHAVDALREAGIPMMGATVTADGLADAAHTGFFRVSAPNRDQAAGAVNYLKEQQRKHPGYKVAVIRDRNTDDIYNTSLSTSFGTAAKAKGLRLEGAPLEYLSGVDGVTNAFSSVADKVCDLAPDAVFFAGRGLNIRNFINSMSAPDRRCTVTLVTGDDALGAYYGTKESEQRREKLRTEWRDSRVTVLYTALGHPALAGALYEKPNDPLPDFVDLYRAEFGGSDDAVAKALEDGQSILGHDAVWTLGVAVRNAAGPDGKGPVNPGATLQMLLQLGGSKAVSGLSGPIAFASDGNPDGKPMALVRMEPSGTYTFRQVLRP